MRSFAITVLVNALAIWVATLVVRGITVTGGEGLVAQIVTFLVVGLIFGVVNAVVKPIVRLVALPLYILTLGLFTFVVNAFMLQITSWVSQVTPLTFEIDDFFWSAIFGAVVVTLVSVVVNVLLPDGRDD